MALRKYQNFGSDSSVKHVGDLSYTEDDILIYTLYVAPPLKRGDENRLTRYFSEFGEVESVKIVTKKKRPTGSFSFAFVNFKDAKSASKALKCNRHFFSNRVLIVRSADSWKQPHQERLPEDAISMEEDQKSNSNYSILNLNDDCLFLIFKCLPFNEQVKLSNLCSRFDFIFHLHYKTTKTLKLDLVESLTLMDFRMGIQKIGHLIENITFNTFLPLKNCTRFIDFVSQYCRNVSKLQLYSLRFKYNDIFHKISTNLSTIKHIELKNCYITDDMTKLLARIKTIEYLDLTDNYEVTGIYLERFKNLRTLILSSCENIQSTFFIKMCNALIHLKELNIRRCDRLNTAAVQALVNNLEELETLTISTCYQTNALENIAQLKNLKHLTINNNQSSNKTDALFTQLAENKKDQLETLKVTNFSYNDVKGDAIIELLKLKQLDLPFATFCTDRFIQKLSKLQKLEILNIPGVGVSKESLLKFLGQSSRIKFIDLSRQTDNDEDFVKNVVEVLKKSNRHQPLTIRVGVTDTWNNHKEKPYLEENKHLLKIDTNQTDYVLEMFDSNFSLPAADSDDEDDDDEDDDDDLYFENEDMFGYYDSDYDDDDDDFDDGYDYMNAWDDLESDYAALFGEPYPFLQF